MDLDYTTDKLKAFEEAQKRLNELTFTEGMLVSERFINVQDGLQLSK